VTSEKPQNTLPSGTVTFLFTDIEGSMVKIEKHIVESDKKEILTSSHPIWLGIYKMIYEQEISNFEV